MPDKVAKRKILKLEFQRAYENVPKFEVALRNVASLFPETEFRRILPEIKAKIMDIMLRNYRSQKPYQLFY